MKPTPANRGIAILFLTVAVGFVGLGGWLAQTQHQRITTYRPTAATVLASGIERQRSSRGTTYSATVRYRYQIGNQTYESGEIRPLSLGSASYSWANEIIARFPVGQHVTAYYNPAAPGQAFLDRRYSFDPYLFIFFAMPFGATGLALWLVARRVAPPVRQFDGWFELDPLSHLADRRRTVAVITGGLVLLGGLAAGHYFLVVPPPFGTLPLVVTGSLGALLLVPIGTICWYTILLREVGDAVVSLNVASITIGQAFKVRVTQPIRANIQVPELELSLVCEVTTQSYGNGRRRLTTSLAYEAKQPGVADNYMRAGEQIIANAQFTIPTGQPASSPATNRGYPRLDWQIRVRTRLASRPDYRAKFPVLIG